MASAAPRPAPRSAEPTPRQRAVLELIQRHIAERGFPPTVAEIAAHFGMRSPNAAAQHLRLLRQKGVLEIEPNRSRGIRLHASWAASRAGAPRAHHAAGHATVHAFPVVGRVAAGSPILAEENRDGEIAVDPHAFAERPDYFLRVIGDSMVDAGILAGDLVAVRRTPEAAGDTIAVVRLGSGDASEVTLKRIRRRGSRVTLTPANARLRPVTVDLGQTDVTVEGVVVGVLRTALSGSRTRR